MLVLVLVLFRGWVLLLWKCVVTISPALCCSGFGFYYCVRCIRNESVLPTCDKGIQKNRNNKALRASRESTEGGEIVKVLLFELHRQEIVKNFLELHSNK